MRDEDADDRAVTAARNTELRDIHHRIDALKEEGERQYGGLIERLHALEVAIASGNRFPASAWVAAAALFLSIVGTGFVTFNKLETALVTSGKSIQLIEAHMAGSSARFQTIQAAESFIAEWTGKLPLIEERVKGLEGRIVGQGPEGWHRRDHDLYAKLIDERNDRVRARLEVIEKRQDQLCERVRECKGPR